MLIIALLSTLVVLFMVGFIVSMIMGTEQQFLSKFGLGWMN